MEDKVFCSDILDALTQDFFARKGNPIEEPAHVEEIKVNHHMKKTIVLTFLPLPLPLLTFLQITR